MPPFYGQRGNVRRRVLMPQWLFVREHARCGGDVAELCRAFGTSIVATERRIATLFEGG